jgi:hypothetical protein
MICTVTLRHSHHAKPMRLSLWKTALQTLREHDQSWVLFVDFVKATIQSTEKCYGRSSQSWSTRKLNRSAQKLYTDVTINSELVRNLNSSLDKRSPNSATPSTCPLCHHSIQHSTRNGISQPDFRWFPDHRWKRSQGTTTRNNQLQQGKMFSFFKSYYVDVETAFILLSRGRVTPPPSLSSHFRRFGLTIHTSREKARDSKRRPFTFRGLDRNHRLLIWRTSK